jgi:hypothetical protein
VFEGPEYSPAKAVPTYPRTSPGLGENQVTSLACNLSDAFDAALFPPQLDPATPVDHSDSLGSNNPLYTTPAAARAQPAPQTHPSPAAPPAPLKARASAEAANSSPSPASPAIPRNLDTDMQDAVHTPGSHHNGNALPHHQPQQEAQAAAAAGGEELLWTDRSEVTHAALLGAPMKDEAAAAAHHQVSADQHLHAVSADVCLVLATNRPSLFSVDHLDINATLYPDASCMPTMLLACPTPWHRPLFTSPELWSVIRWPYPHPLTGPALPG